MNYFNFLNRHQIIAYSGQRYSIEDATGVQEEDTAVTFSQKVLSCSSIEELNNCNADYVLIGIPEDIGVRANFGRAGAAGAWEAFLGAFLNLQHHENNDASRFCVLGNVVVEDLMKDCEHLQSSNHEDRIKLSAAVEEIDDRVTQVIQQVIGSGKLPVIIGGGHNNCYPILRAFNGVAAINIDAHTDLRVAKGRHSGNGFSHALEHGYLRNYFMIGLQENYLSEPMIELLHDDLRLAYTTYKFDYLNISEEVQLAIDHIDSTNYGLEIDMDVVANFPSSAQSPIGFSMERLRKTVKEILEVSDEMPRYIHICEAAPVYGYPNQVGKALANLVNDLP
ncbi:MAG: formimidoylglutamase [Nonlabens sp.]|uniref:formimidoylglutamase n=1 Tax=Nonlabens sp. TaxID=1888209 RepID=UPI003EF4AFA4